MIEVEDEDLVQTAISGEGIVIGRTKIARMRVWPFLSLGIDAASVMLLKAGHPA